MDHPHRPVQHRSDGDTRLVRTGPRLDFQPGFPTPAGDYHLFAYSETGGGGIRHTTAEENPGSTPTVHVQDTQAAYDAALAAGAEPVTPPTTVMDGVRTAMVLAPGGILIGFSGPTE